MKTCFNHLMVLASLGSLTSHAETINSTANWVYELPFGKNRRFLANANPAVDALLGGWEWSGIWTQRTGLTLTATSAECGSNCAMGSTDRTQRADVVAGQSIAIDAPTNFRWFNTAAFRPAATPFGSAGRGTIYAPGLRNWDFTLGKSFQINERFRLQFRSEFFNAFNQVNLDSPNTNVSTGTFGVITSALPGRSIQLGLKLYY